MDRLPPEIFYIVLSFLPKRDLFRYATVSRYWQHALEPQIFKSVKFKSTELDYFARIYAPSHRRAALGEIEYGISLPGYPAWKCTKFEKPKDQDANNEAFTKAVVGLFDILNGWETVGSAEEREETPIKLYMSASSPSDDPEGREIRGDLGENRWRNSVLKMTRPDEVKPVERVKGFSWGEYQDLDEEYLEERGSMRDVDAASVASIAAKFPRLETILWCLRDRGFPGTQPRYQQRHEFGLQLATVKTTSLKRLTIGFEFYQPLNEAFSIPSALHPSDQSTDPLSLSLHSLSQAPRLEYIFLGGCSGCEMVISPSFFWPENSPTTPLWPSLQNVSIHISNTTPSGSWYFDGEDEGRDIYSDSEYDTSTPTVASETELSEDSNVYFTDTFHPYHTAISVGERPIRNFRTRINLTLFNPLLVSVAKAVLRMPVLRSFDLEMSSPSSMDEVSWMLYAKGVSLYPSEDPPKSSVPRIYLRLWEGMEWRGDDELKALWRKIVGTDGLIDVRTI